MSATHEKQTANSQLSLREIVKPGDIIYHISSGFLYLFLEHNAFQGLHCLFVELGVARKNFPCRRMHLYNAIYTPGVWLILKCKQTEVK